MNNKIKTYRTLAIRGTTCSATMSTTLQIWARMEKTSYDNGVSASYDQRKGNDSYHKDLADDISRARNVDVDSCEFDGRSRSRLDCGDGFAENATNLATDACDEREVDLRRVSGH